jgi:biopolymer transport protein ExbD
MSVFDGGSRRTQGDIDVEIDMVPVMNMFLVLIPFLLMSSSFLHLKAINTSVPVKAVSEMQLQPEVSDIEITAIVEINAGVIKLTTSSEQLPEATLKLLDATFAAASEVSGSGDGNYRLIELTQALQKIKAQYPKSNTLILVPGADVLYDTIVQTMDAARRVDDADLFPNVVLSGTVSSREYETMFRTLS